MDRGLNLPIDVDEAYIKKLLTDKNLVERIKRETKENLEHIRRPPVYWGVRRENLVFYKVTLHPSNFYKYLNSSELQREAVAFIDCKFLGKSDELLDYGCHIRFGNIFKMHIVRCRADSTLYLEGNLGGVAIVAPIKNTEINVKMPRLSPVKERAYSPAGDVAPAAFTAEIIQGRDFHAHWGRERIGDFDSSAEGSHHTLDIWGQNEENGKYYEFIDTKNLIFSSNPKNVNVWRFGSDLVAWRENMENLHINKCRFGDFIASKEGRTKRSEIRVDVKNTKFLRNLDFTAYSLHPASSFSDTRLLAQAHEEDPRWKKEGRLGIQKKEEYRSLSRANLEYLQNEFERIKRYETAREIFVAERKYAFMGTGFLEYMWGAYGLISNHGESVARPLLTLSLWILAFSFSYILFPGVDWRTSLFLGATLGIPFLTPISSLIGSGMQTLPHGVITGLFILQFMGSVVLWVLLILGVRYNFRFKV